MAMKVVVEFDPLESKMLEAAAIVCEQTVEEFVKREVLGSLVATCDYFEWDLENRQKLLEK